MFPALRASEHARVQAVANRLQLPEHSPPSRATLYAVLDSDDVISRCQRGDKAAFRLLFLRHRAEVGRLVFRMVGPRVDLEDVVQEVFLQVHRSLKDFRGQSKFTTWLHRVTVNVVLMHRRAAKSRPQLVAPQVEDSQPDSRIAPDEDAARLERMRAFRRLIERLPEKKRVVFILHELEGMAPVEISEIVGAPVLTVRTRLFYARRELAEMLREEPSLAGFADAFARNNDSDRVPLSRKPLGELR
jgi:RNA polymerase sigma-70 factor, ECF subfamily